MGLVGLAVVSFGIILLISAFSDTSKSWLLSLVRFIDEIEAKGWTIGRAMKAFLLLVPFSLLAFNGLVLITAATAGLFGYAFEQPIGFKSVYEFFEGFLSPKYIRWQFGAHVVLWVWALFDFQSKAKKASQS